MAKEKYYIRINLAHPDTYNPNTLAYLEEAIRSLEHEQYEFVLYFYYEGEAGENYYGNTFQRIEEQNIPHLDFPTTPMEEPIRDHDLNAGGYDAIREIAGALSPIAKHVTEIGLVGRIQGYHSQNESDVINMILFWLVINGAEIDTLLVNTDTGGGVGVLGGVVDGLGCRPTSGFLFPQDGEGRMLELIRESASYNALKHLHINYNEIADAKQTRLHLSEILRLIKEQKNLETLKISAPKEAWDNTILSTQLVANPEEMEALTEIIKERNLKVSFEGHELLLGGMAHYLLPDEARLSDRKVTQSYANSHTPKEIYLPALFNFLNQLVDSELSIAAPESSYAKERANTWYSIRENFFNLLEEVLEQVNNSPENTVSIIGDYLRISGPFGSVFDPEPRDPEDARYVYTKDLSLGRKISSLITKDSIIEEDQENPSRYVLKNEFGEEYTLNWQELQLLLEVAAVRGYTAIQESLNEILVRNFWQKNEIFTEEGGNYFGDTYISKEVLDCIASFLHQNLHISKQRDINPSANLHFTHEQMNTLGKEIVSQTPGIFQYLDAIDGVITDNHSSKDIRNIINEYGRKKIPFIAPIEVGPGDRTQSFNLYKKDSNHWLLYLHYGSDQDKVLRSYFLCPLPERDTPFEVNINNIMQSLWEKFLAVAKKKAPTEVYIRTCFQEDSYNSGVWVLYMIQKLQEQMDKRAPEIADYAPDMPHSRYMIEQVIESIREEQPNVFRLREAYETLYNRIRNQEDEVQPQGSDNNNAPQSQAEKQVEPEGQEDSKLDSAEEKEEQNEEEQATELMPDCGLEESYNENDIVLEEGWESTNQTATDPIDDIQIDINDLPFGGYDHFGSI